MPVRLLQKATRLLKNKKFSKVVHLLEPEIFQFRENFRFYYLLGTSCLYADDLKGAESYLNRAHQINNRDVNCLLGLATIALRMGEVEEALKIWLDIIDREPTNRVAKRGLSVARSDYRLSNFLQKKRLLSRLYPPIPKKPPIVPFLAAGVLTIGLIVAIPALIRSMGEKRPELEEIRLPERGVPLLANQGSFRYELTSKEVRETFERAKRFFNQYRDNLCLLELNRLIYSNASEEVKNTARMLSQYIKKPDFSTLKDSFSLSQVSKDPYLYQGCYVIWQGKVANLKVGPNRISFDFLVGYHREQELEGIVPVRLDFATSLDNGYNLEVLGQIAYTNEILSLKGFSIHRIE
jgi:tetratricopeptide (TPR) repeat protein